MATWHSNRWRAAGRSPEGYSQIAVIAAFSTLWSRWIAVVGAAYESHEFYGDAFVKHLFRYLWSWTLRGFKPVIHAVDTQSQQRILCCYHSLQHGTTV